MEPKPGYKTTEAMGTLLASALAVYGIPDPNIAYGVVGALVAVYTHGRSMVKQVKDKK